MRSPYSGQDSDYGWERNLCRKKYQFQRGDIFFTNPVRIDPTIDLDVTARVENYDITVGLHGTLTNLKPTFRSEPPLSEADVFALLALGRTQEEASCFKNSRCSRGSIRRRVRCWVAR